MKRFLTCALCFMSLPVFADVTLYYDKTGVCSGLRLNANCDGNPVSQLNVTTKPDRDTGYYVNGNLIVDYAGNIAVDALEKLRNANLSSGATVPQNTTCMTGATLNASNSCVRDDTSYVFIDPTTGITIDADDLMYDFEGAREFALDKDAVSDTGKSGSAQRRYYEFDVVLHWCPPSYGDYSWTWNDGVVAQAGTEPVPEWSGILSTACTKNPVTLHYSWPDNGSGGHPHVEVYSPSTGQYYLDEPGAAGYYYNGQRVACIDVENQRIITDESQCNFGTWNGNFYNPNTSDQNYLVYNNGNGGIKPGDEWVFRGFFIVPEIGAVPSGCEGTTVPLDHVASQECIIYWGNRNALAKRLVTNKTERSARARLSATANHPYIIDVTDTAPNNTANDVHNGDIYSYWNTRWGILSETTIPTNYKVHLYGGWARMCETTSDSNCSLYIGYGANTGTMDNIGSGNFWWARDGSATYTTSCNSGTPQVAENDDYLEQGTPSDGTYYPICKTQGDRSLLYIGNSTTCSVNASSQNSHGTGRTNWSCNPNQAYTLLSATDVTCGPAYEATGWMIDKVTKRGSLDFHTSVYHQLGDTIMCTNNDLGLASPVKINIFACEKCDTTKPHVTGCGEQNAYGCREIICEEGYNVTKVLDSNGMVTSVECR